MILEHKADVTVKTAADHTALDIAKMTKYSERDERHNQCIKLLEAAEPSFKNKLMNFFKHPPVEQPQASALPVPDHKEPASQQRPQ